MSQPLVSCIMITGKSPERAALALAACESYSSQTYWPRELVIINDGGVPLLPRMAGCGTIREIMVPKQPTLGHLRNIGLEEARGDFIGQLDDDDFHGPERISLQVEAAVEHGCPVTLQSQIRYSFKTRNCYHYRKKPRTVDLIGIAGTIVHQRSDLRYDHASLHEDSWYAKKFPRIYVLDNQPELYIRFHHGNNSWSEAHLMASLRFGRGRNLLNQPQREYLAGVLAKHYSGLKTTAASG